MGAFSKWYVMKYGEPYKIVKFSDPSMSVVRSAISNTNLKWNEGKLQEGNNNSCTFTLVHVGATPFGYGADEMSYCEEFGKNERYFLFLKVEGC